MRKRIKEIILQTVKYIKIYSDKVFDLKQIISLE